MDKIHQIRLPKWLKREIPHGNTDHLTEKLIKNLGLTTVCDHAKCPNRMECFARKTATFMMLGPICTRNCRFCAVSTGTPSPPDATEPQKIAQAVSELGLSHVVLTMVSRDDLPDGGVSHFVQCLEAVRQTSTATIEVLPSDFGGNMESVDQLSDSLPEVYNYNTETIPRLYPSIRGSAPNYRQMLAMFRRIHVRHPNMKLKSGIILGLGETLGEVLELFADLLQSGCQMLTIGQYLQPSPHQIPVQKYYTPEEFEEIGKLARHIGFRHVVSGPFIRSSYHAAEALRTNNEMVVC